MKIRYALAMMAAVGLSACAERDVAYNSVFVTDFGTYKDAFDVRNHADASGEIAEAAAWNDARNVTLTVRQNEFSPMIVHLKKDVPYVIKVVNKDQNSVSFNAGEFFENTSVDSINEAMYEDETYPARAKPQLKSFVVPPKGERMVKLVPVLEGRYEFEDNAPGFFLPNFSFSPWSRAATMGTSGVFVVE
ncbi:exported hypothetical protein [Candidatus Terasakiella magnetica]|uniref:DUF2846 domain-containing protein n=1 Tax=Candidatus Terasakiella magnetica TaxID=1867952 RepID=A0A1C3RIS0_9PROT|nr:hypothetical protein [Candidatus Terasakiella magnetica]SCA57161.1 exported hypothetical protein [Candidatus Terasakiella magnetica]